MNKIREDKIMTQEKAFITPASLGEVEQDVSKEMIYLDPEEAKRLYLEGYQAPHRRTASRD
jgi:hypothetical protein